MLPDMELAEAITPAQVLSLAEEMDVNPAVAIIEKFRREGGDDTELAQAIRAVKLKEEAKKWAYAVISLVMLCLMPAYTVFYKDFVCSVRACVCVCVCACVRACVHACVQSHHIFSLIFLFYYSL